MDSKQSNIEQTLNLEETVKETDKTIYVKRLGVFIQSLGLVAFLFGIIVASVTISMSDDRDTTTYLVMFFVMSAAIWMAAYRFRYIAVIVGGLQTLIYTAFQLYESIVGGKEIILLDYVWIFLPEFCIGSMILFMMNMYKVEKMAEVLEDQIQNLETIEPITGLNNLRSMYMDLERQMAYCERSNIELTLIIFELRYYQELKSIMTSREFSELKRKMARLTEDALRLEDRVYAIDDRGSLGLVCIGCGREGATIVKNRIISAFSDKSSFEGILDRKLRVDVRAGFYIYDRGEINNAIEFKQKAENELQYDV